MEEKDRKTKHFNITLLTAFLLESTNIHQKTAYLLLREAPNQKLTYSK